MLRVVRIAVLRETISKNSIMRPFDSMIKDKLIFLYRLAVETLAVSSVPRCFDVRESSTSGQHTDISISCLSEHTRKDGQNSEMCEWRIAAWVMTLITYHGIPRSVGELVK